jgi:hypothetical protein
MIPGRAASQLLIFASSALLAIFPPPTMLSTARRRSKATRGANAGKPRSRRYEHGLDNRDQYCVAPEIRSAQSRAIRCNQEFKVTFDDDEVGSSLISLGQG